MPFVFPDLSNVFCMSKFCFEYAYMALFAIPFIILLYFIMQRSFIRFFDKSEQLSYEREKKSQRLMFFILRSLVFLFLLIAIASPFIMETTTVKGNPRITILIDNSTSNLLTGSYPIFGIINMFNILFSYSFIFTPFASKIVPFARSSRARAML